MMSIQIPAITSDKSIQCINPKGYFSNICERGDISISVIRCNKCDNCERFRIKQIRRQAYLRIKQNKEYLENREVLFWTLGTSWDYTKKNYEKIRRAFTLYRKRLRNYGVMRVYFYVYEMGTLGGKLHVHFITDFDSKNIMDYNHAVHLWQELTEPDRRGDPKNRRKCKKCDITFNKWSNTYYKRVKRCIHCKKIVDYYEVNRHCSRKNFESVGIGPALGYSIKYMSKQFQGQLKFNYYWGNQLRFRYEVTNTVQSDLDGKITGRITEVNPVERYRETEYWRYDGKSEREPGQKGSRQFDYIDGSSRDIRYYVDRSLRCYCGAKLIVKGAEFDNKLTSKLILRFGTVRANELVTEIRYMEVKPELYVIKMAKNAEKVNKT